MADTTRQRERMVERQIAKRGIEDARVLDALRKVPREAFVPEGLREQAYDDSPLPIGEGQTISQPYIVALMAGAAALRPEDRVLEIGTGSGYAAAVLATLARKVFTVERHASLAEAARSRLHVLGFDNVEVRVGDGTRGWPEAAPFDAILAAAGGPEVPDELKRQLAIGGRLIMPVGPEPQGQTLVKLTRTSGSVFTREDLGAVRFVPLVGAFGWPQPDEPTSGESLQPETLAARIRMAAEPLPALDDASFGARFDRFGRCRVVALGEASHGTSEFYRARAAITRHLVEHHGFTIVAVEADWPDAATYDRLVRGKSSAPDPEAFARFPTWMWRNVEMAAFFDWLRQHNLDVEPDRQGRFYGLDLYSLNGSMRAVIDYLDRTDPEAAKVARRRYGCLAPWQDEPHRYGRAALREGMAPCEDAVVTILRDLLNRQLEHPPDDPDSYVDATENARLVRDAERYYRAMYYGSSESWNLRDRHMFGTLRRLLDAAGPDSKAVVWAHNSHIGDARETGMSDRGELNLGQLIREAYDGEAALIGFGTHRGTVAAADDWDEPVQVKQVNPSLRDSVEWHMHEAGVPRFLLDLREGGNPGLRDALSARRLERFIGVIYRPETERYSHYIEAALARQFDAYVWLDETSAVTPLAGRQQVGDEDTFPSGL